jgi:plasmid stabilization system protein ParE
VARLVYAESALQDLERLISFLGESEPTITLETLSLIEEAVLILRQHPYVGRPAEAGLRELVVSRGRTGYVALYSVEEAFDTVLVLAIRHQREVGYQ